MSGAIDVPMSPNEAKQVTDQIRRVIGTIAQQTSKVLGLIEQAEAGLAWQALGYDSWPSYVAAEFGDALSGLARAERIPITAKLSETGMSTRAIATVTGVSHKTIVKDRQVVPEVPPEDRADQVPDSTKPAIIVGRDGKSYPRSRPTAQQAQDIGSAVPPITRRPVPTYAEDYQKQIVELFRVIGRLTVLHKDDQFTREATPLEATRLRVASRMLADAADQHEQACRG